MLTMNCCFGTATELIELYSQVMLYGVLQVIKNLVSNNSLIH